MLVTATEKAMLIDLAVNKDGLNSKFYSGKIHSSPGVSGKNGFHAGIVVVNSHKSKN